MKIRPRLPLVAAALVSLLAPLAISADPAQATATPSAKPAPQLYVSSSPGPGNPLTVRDFNPDRVPASPRECIDASGDYYDDCFNLTVTVSADQDVSDLTATVVEHKGLYVDPLVTQIPSLQAHQGMILSYVVRARTNGLHTFTVEVAAPGVETRRVSLPYVWGRGGLVKGSDLLTGRRYGATTTESFRCGDGERCTYRESHRLDFRDTGRQGGRFARVLPYFGDPSCGRASGCDFYRYNKATGLISLGYGELGRVTRRGIVADGVRYAPMAYPKPRTTLNGHWSFETDADEGRGVSKQDLRLRRNGRFVLSFTVDSYQDPGGGPDINFTRTRRGYYEIEGHGAIQLGYTHAFESFSGEIAVFTDRSGKPRANKLGIWLDLNLEPRGRDLIDGNRLSPVSD